jgi:VanZ family protein
MDMLKKAYISPSLNLWLYSLLLIFTPFILLQNYLQDIIGNVSKSSISLGSIDIHYSVFIFSLLVFFLIFKTRKTFSLPRAITWLLVFVFWFIGQQTSDFYLNNEYYDLQNNWHYIAYGLFVVVAYNALSSKINNTARLIFAIFIRALLISTFDETIQIFISNRVFDVSDISKDVWGAMAGMLVLFIGYKNPEVIKNTWKISQPKIKDYFNNALSMLVILSVFSYILLAVSSLLTDSKYIVNILFISILLFFIVFVAIHLSFTKFGKRIVLGMVAVLFLVLSISFVSHYNKQISYHKSGITLYKGIPLLYFDVMIFDHGGFRFVDKKDNFNQGDIKFFLEKTSNILLIGCGAQSHGRMGFPEDLQSQFMYNFIQKKPIQIIILPTSEACDTYNRLKEEGKKVTFVIHNTYQISGYEAKK